MASQFSPSKILQNKALQDKVLPVAGFGASFVATNMLFPGGFWRNATSSLAFEGTRRLSKFAGAGNIKSLIFGGAASVITSALYGSIAPQDKLSRGELINESGFSGADDRYNTIKGLHPGSIGLATHNIRANTAFGSGWDRVKAIFGLSQPNQMLDEDQDPRLQFEFFKQSLEKYGRYVGTGHKRILIPKSYISEEELTGALGFVPTAIAIPEAGQKSMTSYRNPNNLYHLHEYEDVWSMHKDVYASSTMQIEKLKQNNPEVSKFRKAVETIKGLPHVITEGIPGLYYYASGALSFNRKSMEEKLKESVSSQYLSYVGLQPDLDRDVNDKNYSGKMITSGVLGLGVGIGFNLAHRKNPKKLLTLGAFATAGALISGLGLTFSGRDDDYNTIEGIHPGGTGLGAQVVKMNTDFGSGSQIAKKFFYAIRKGTKSGKSLLESIKEYGESQGVKYLKPKEFTEEFMTLHTKMSPENKKILYEKALSMAESGASAERIGAVSLGTEEVIKTTSREAGELAKVSNPEKMHQTMVAMHETLELLHSRANNLKPASKFGSHFTEQVIEDEAFLAKALDEKLFSYANAFRKTEGSTNIQYLEKTAEIYKRAPEETKKGVIEAMFEESKERLQKRRQTFSNSRKASTKVLADEFRSGATGHTQMNSQKRS